MDGRFDIAIVGGGIVGLSTARHLLRLKPGLKLALLEKESGVAGHQTSHNSGVLHAGLYYAPGSKKALLCREGKAALEKFAAERGIPFERCGKLVVALDASELPAARGDQGSSGRQRSPRRRGGRTRADPELEPHAAGIRGLWSPETGIIDFGRVAQALADDVRAAGGTILTGRRVVGIEERGSERVLHTSQGDLACRDLVACGGLHADRLAAMTGHAGGERVVPFRGDYYTLIPAARRLVRNLIYPVPDPRFPFLGVHFTRTVHGEVLAGPNAVLAFAREGYRRTDFSPSDLFETLAYPGFRKLARRFWRTGLAETWRDWSKGAFTASLARYVPEIRSSDLVFGPSGVRAQSVSADGTLVDDFSIGKGRTSSTSATPRRPPPPRLSPSAASSPSWPSIGSG